MKSNNANVDLKLDLRRRVIHASGFKKIRLLDLYGGASELWAGMKKEFPIETVMVGAVKPPRKSIASPPLLIEAIGRMRINVIEIEIPGDPWELWAAVARRIVQRTAVFVTLGASGRRPASKFTREALGIPIEWEIPSDPALVAFAARYFLAPRADGPEIRGVWRAFDGSSTTFGILARKEG